MENDFGFPDVPEVDLLEETETSFYLCFDCSPVVPGERKLCANCNYRRYTFMGTGRAAKPKGCALPSETDQRAYLSYIHFAKTEETVPEERWTEADLNEVFPTRLDIAPNTMAKIRIASPYVYREAEGDQPQRERSRAPVAYVALESLIKTRFEREIEFSEKTPEEAIPSRMERPNFVASVDVSNYIERLAKRSTRIAGAVSMVMDKFQTLAPKRPTRFELVLWDDED